MEIVLYKLKTFRRWKVGSGNVALATYFVNLARNDQRFTMFLYPKV